jgi:hypothetical protein
MKARSFVVEGQFAWAKQRFRPSPDTLKFFWLFLLSFRFDSADLGKLSVADRDENIA